MAQWDGIERRKTMDSEIQDLKIEVATLSERVKNWMVTTDEHRKNQRETNNIIINKLQDLPCKEGWALKKSQGFQIKLLWGFVTAIILAIISEWVRIK